MVLAQPGLKEPPTPPKTWGARCMRDDRIVNKILESFEPTSTHHVTLIAAVALQVTSLDDKRSAS